VFSRYDKDIEGASRIPKREAKMLFGEDPNVGKFKFSIPTDVQVYNAYMATWRMSKPSYLPVPVTANASSPRTFVGMRLKLSGPRVGLDLRNTPIVLSPGMDNYEELMDKARRLTTVHNRLNYYNKLVGFIMHIIGTTTKLRTVWPEILPFVPAESRQAMSKRSRKAWPVDLCRAINDAATTQEAVAKDLASIAANVVHASMLPSTTLEEIEAANSPKITKFTFLRVPNPPNERYSSFSKPDSYPNYRSDLY
jgi:hypothetical protein